MQEYADTSFLVSLYVFDSNTARRMPRQGVETTAAAALHALFRFRTEQHAASGASNQGGPRLAAKRIRGDFGAEFTWQPVQGYRLIDEADRVSRLVTAKHRARALDVCIWPTPGSRRARVAVVDKASALRRSISD